LAGKHPKLFSYYNTRNSIVKNKISDIYIMVRKKRKSRRKRGKKRTKTRKHRGGENEITVENLKNFFYGNEGAQAFIKNEFTDVSMLNFFNNLTDEDVQKKSTEAWNMTLNEIKGSFSHVAESKKKMQRGGNRLLLLLLLLLYILDSFGMTRTTRQMLWEDSVFSDRRRRARSARSPPRCTCGRFLSGECRC
jgi:hypothetical protein